LPGAGDVLGPTVAAKQQVRVIEFLLPSRFLSAGLVSVGLQLTANATAGKNRMPSVFGFIVVFKSRSALLCCVPIVSPYPLAKVVPSLPHPDKCAKPAQESYRRKPRNYLVTNSIGDFLD
jgi:hypothetical protein